MTQPTVKPHCAGVPGQVSPVPWCDCADCEKKRRVIPQVTELLERCDDMMLATLRADGFPHANTVSFVNNGVQLYFGTQNGGQKVKNIAHSNKVAVSIRRPYRRWEDIQGVSITGRASLVTDLEEMIWATGLLKERHHNLSALLPTDPDDALIFRIDPVSITFLDYAQALGHSETIVAPEVAGSSGQADKPASALASVPRIPGRAAG